MADVENSVPVSTEIRFRTASIAKSMTAVTVLALVEDGAIDLDADVRRYCPEFPEKRWPITSRQLLGHLGGIRHYKSGAETRSTRHFDDLTSALSTFADDPLLHQPGTAFRYSTFGYNLLGSVTEGARDERFRDLLKEKVLEPAGMTRTVVDDHFRVIPGRARGYSRVNPSSPTGSSPRGDGSEDGEIRNAPLHDTSVKIPGGGLLSTPTDLVRFAISVNTGRLLREETRERMWTSQSTADGQLTGYGWGWKIGERDGRKLVWHTGGQAGTSTVLMLFPDSGTCVAIMCNLQQVKLTGVAESVCAIVEG